MSSWDADKYTKDFSFVHRYGSSVTELIDKKEGMRLLDLGCGNGALTNELKTKGFDAFGLDSSPELLNIAKENYPEIEFILGDAVNFKLNSKVDVVFSNAVLHWIAREAQPKLLSCVYECLKPGGQFVFEMGGAGNNILIHSALEKEFTKRGYKYQMPFYFPTIGEYSALLENAGFSVKYGILFDRPTELKGENGMADWLRMFIRTPFENIAGAEKDEIICAAAEALRVKLYKDGKWYSDYVRLRMKAVKPC